MLNYLTSRAVLWASGALVAVLLVLLGFVSLGERAAKRDLATVEADRGLLVGWAEKVCGVTGEPFKATRRADWGQACFARVVMLQAFRTKSTDATNAELVKNLQSQLTKKEADLARATRDKRLAFAALDALTEAASNVPVSNEVGPGYYGPLNRAAGLRDAEAAAP